MASTDLAQLERNARWAYELGRTRRAVLGVLPVIAIVAIAAYFANRPVSTLAFGVATLFVGAVMLWYGRDPQKAVLPGIAAGLAPLVLALCANQVHVCGPEGCSSLCVPACVLGGAIAGLAVANVGARRKAGLLFWVSASGLALLTGSMGCACIGYSGVVGLVLGFGVGVMPGVWRRSHSEKAP
jgi:hypothetical protein